MRRRRSEKTLSVTRSLPALPSRYYQALDRRVDQYQHAHVKVPADERLRLPLPLRVPAAEDECLTWATEPLVSDDEQLLPACADATLSSLGVGLSRLVAIGGRDAHGELLPAEMATLACDPILHRWRPIGVAEEPPPPSCGAKAGARFAHAAAVVGHNRSLLVVAGGQGVDGCLLSDTHVLDMRAQESAEGSERRRQLAGTRRSLLEALVTMRARQRAMQRGLAAALDHSAQWEALLKLAEEEVHVHERNDGKGSQEDGGGGRGTEAVTSGVTTADATASAALVADGAPPLDHLR